MCARYNNDLWLWDLDWSVQDVRIKKAKPPKKGRKKKQVEEIEDDDKVFLLFLFPFLL